MATNQKHILCHDEIQSLLEKLQTDDEDISELGYRIFE